MIASVTGQQGSCPKAATDAANAGGKDDQSGTALAGSAGQRMGTHLRHAAHVCPDRRKSLAGVATDDEPLVAGRPRSCPPGACRRRPSRTVPVPSRWNSTCSNTWSASRPATESGELSGSAGRSATSMPPRWRRSTTSGCMSRSGRARWRCRTRSRLTGRPARHLRRRPGRALLARAVSGRGILDRVPGPLHRQGQPGPVLLGLLRSGRDALLGPAPDPPPTPTRSPGSAIPPSRVHGRLLARWHLAQRRYASNSRNSSPTTIPSRRDPGSSRSAPAAACFDTGLGEFISATTTSGTGQRSTPGDPGLRPEHVRSRGAAAAWPREVLEWTPPMPPSHRRAMLAT